jgi:hypothetical protein
MKNLLLISSILLLLAASAAGQARVKKDAKGNFISLSQFAEICNKTGEIFTDSKGRIYPVYKTKRGKLFYNKISKSGRQYKIFLLEE